MLYQFYQQHIFPHVLNQVMQTSSLMDQRRELLMPIQGDVLEIGFGTGVNLPFYQNVDTLYALEPSAEVFLLAEPRLRESSIYVEHIVGRAEKLPFADASFEHIVSTWTLCSVGDLNQTLAEIHRVLKPSGTFHLVEHVRYPEHDKLKHLQNLLTPIQKKLADGCHLNRNIEQALNDANFQFQHKIYFAAEGIPKVGQRMLLARVNKKAA